LPVLGGDFGEHPTTTPNAKYSAGSHGGTPNSASDSSA
jgi:hypothetical protein